MFTDSSVVHRGQLIKFECLHLNRNIKADTILTACLHEYIPASKCFRKREETPAQITLDGQWNIVCSAKVVCDITNVTQPCVVVCKVSLNQTVSKTLQIYQLRDLRHLAKIFTTEKLEIEPFCGVSNHWDKRRLFLVDGPSIIFIDIQTGNVTCIRCCNGQACFVQARFLKTAEQPFLVNSATNIRSTELTFIGIINNAENVKSGDRSCTQNNPKTSRFNAFGFKWVQISVTVAVEPQFHISVSQYSVNLPPVYCTITTAVLLVETEKFFIATKCGQIVMICNGNIDGVCDIPLSNCDVIKVIGDGKYAVVITTSTTEKKGCAVGLSSFEVVKTWDLIGHHAVGMLPVNDDVSETVLLFHRNSQDADIFSCEEFTIVSSLEDVLSKTREKITDFRLHSPVDLPLDTEYDLFSSPPKDNNHWEDGKKALTKVIKSLEMSVDKHRSLIDDMRLSLHQKDQAIAVSTTAILEMNNYINFYRTDNAGKDDLNGDLVDLFTSEPCSFDNNQSPGEKLVKLEKVWQRVVHDQWVIGFSLVNISQKSFTQFGVILSPLKKDDSQVSLISSHLTITTKYFKSSHGLKGRLKHFYKQEHDSFRKENLPEHVPLNNVAPGEEVVVIAMTKIPNFSSSLALSSPLRLAYSSAVMVTMDNSNCVNEDDYIFHIGKLCISASDVATCSLSINFDNLTNIDSGNCKEEILAIKCCHNNKSVFSLSSKTSNISLMSQAILQSLGFNYYEKINGYLCISEGPFYLVFIERKVISKYVTYIIISCRSNFEESLLLSYIREQVPSDLIIQLKMDPKIKEEIESENDKLKFIRHKMKTWSKGGKGILGNGESSTVMKFDVCSRENLEKHRQSIVNEHKQVVELCEGEPESSYKQYLIDSVSSNVHINSLLLRK